VSSGLLPIVAIDAPVFRRSAVVVAAGGDSGFLLELFLDSQAKGPVSFLVVVGAGAGAGFSCTAGGAGGGGNLTGDILPERPCSPLAEFVESRESRGGSLGSMPAAFEPSVKRQLQFCDQHAFTHADAYVGGASEWVQMAPALEV
jgi:hypothetical protein